MGFNMLFYIIFGTKLLTEGLVLVSFFAYFSVSQKRNIKQSPNGMKPSRESRRLGVDIMEATRRPGGRRAHPRGVGAPPTLVGPS